MSQIAIAWQWAKGVTSPIIGATKMQYLDDAAGALNVRLTAEGIAYLKSVMYHIRLLVRLIRIRRRV